MKYKLIKEYPGSSKLGTIQAVTQTYNFLHLYPEFWEIVVEKDYEILSYIHNGSKHIWKKDSQLKDTFCLEDGKSPFTRLEDILKYPKIYLIHSIKRLSDGEIFTVGDAIHNKNCQIYDFIINVDRILLVGVTGNETRKLLKEVQHIKKPLFTTKDGVDIFEGDTAYSVFIEQVCSTQPFSLATMKVNKCIVRPFKSVLDFSTLEKAEEYILLNKPVLSYGEIQEYLKIKDCNKVLDLVQSKIQQSV